ncbi:cytochrome c [Aggregatimonas sangjinii]|uniref:Cytochrome c n=1 Tax=Aggregatimonas sangjinii TaxID=2583587 RepID=A0A5B7SLX9_9FLAO|nr:cytochrome c [Aggregatimonas sangjinii]QCW99625.1 cytochrome c [Aggregatimonas sangjinii]
MVKRFSLKYLFLVASVATCFSQEPDVAQSIARGSEIYTDFCVTCHLTQGEGVAGVFPPLADSDYLRENREASIRGIKFGQQGELVVNGETYDGVMAPMGLEDEEIADVMNYILNSFENRSDTIVTVDEVAAIAEK